MKWILSLFLMFVLTACLEDINLDGIAQKHLVVEARIPFGEEARVKISETVSKTRPNIFPEIDRADVRIYDELGNSDSLVFGADGIYRATNITGTLNTRYFVEIRLDDSLITGASRMPERVVEVDSIWYEEVALDTSGVFKDAFITYNFTTPSGGLSHGLAKVFVNGTQLETVHFFENAAQFNEFTVPSNILLGPGQEIKVELQRVEPQVYDYLKTIYEGEGSSSLTIAPVAPPNNPVANLEGDVLGLFSAMAVGRKIIITE